MADVPISNLTTTWTESGTNYSGVKLNVTNTASGALSKLIDLQVGGSTKFNVGKDGDITVGGPVTAPTGAMSGNVLTPDDGSMVTRTLTSNTTFTDGLSDGQSLLLKLDAGDTYTVTWPTITWITSNGNVAPTLTSTDTLVFWKIGSTLYGAYIGNGE